MATAPSGLMSDKINLLSLGSTPASVTNGIAQSVGRPYKIPKELRRDFERRSMELYGRKLTDHEIGTVVDPFPSHELPRELLLDEVARFGRPMTNVEREDYLVYGPTVPGVIPR